MGTEGAWPRLLAIDTWTREERIAAISLPTLVRVTTARSAVRREPRARGRITQAALAVELSRLHKLFNPQKDAGWLITPKDVSDFASAMIGAPDPPFGGLFLVWLADRLHAGEFLRIAPIYDQLSVFNFADAIALFILEERPLPRLGVATPSAPLLGPLNDAPLSLEEQIAEDEKTVSQALGNLLGIDDLAPVAFERRFFRDGEQKACFVVYRHAARIEDSLIKGLLVIERPKTVENDCFSFTHFYSDNGPNSRKTRGFVLSISNRHYFVGGTGPTVLETKSRTQPSRPRGHFSDGMKLLVVDSNQQSANNHIWGGLFISHDRSYAPIAGRCVLIRSKFDWHDEVAIGLVPFTQLRADIAAHCDLDDATLEAELERIELAIDNSYEPGKPDSRTPDLRGPLTLVPGLPDMPVHAKRRDKRTRKNAEEE